MLQSQIYKRDGVTQTAPYVQINPVNITQKYLDYIWKAIVLPVELFCMFTCHDITMKVTKNKDLINAKDNVPSPFP